MAGTVTRILCKCNFPCDKGVEWPDRNSELRLPSGRRSSARLTRRRGSRLMARGNPHRKSVHFEVLARRSDKSEALGAVETIAPSVAGRLVCRLASEPPIARNVAPNALGSRTAARCRTSGPANGPMGATNSWPISPCRASPPEKRKHQSRGSESTRQGGLRAVNGLD